MATSGLPENLSNHHVRTLNALFEHPIPHNIEWRNVRTLIAAVGTVDERHDGKFALAIGEATLIVEIGPGKDLDAQQVVNIRRLLQDAGLGPLDRSDRAR